MTSKNDYFRSRYGTSHIPEDKDQHIVKTPYGKGLVVRTIRNGGDSSSTTNDSAIMREVHLLDWKKAETTSSSSSSKMDRRPATLYTSTRYPSVHPQVGDDVLCPYGRGRVLEIRHESHVHSGAGSDVSNTDITASSPAQVVIQLSNWRLAKRSRVTCILSDLSHVHVVRHKKLYEMSVYEKVEHAQQLKQQASAEFTSKNYVKALELYGQAVEAVRYVQHRKDSNNQVRADLLVLMITCCNNAATCCSMLSSSTTTTANNIHWDEALKSSHNAIVLIDALEKQSATSAVGGGGKTKIHTVINTELQIDDIKLFGVWKVKSLLISARANYEKGLTDKAIELLKQAHGIVAKYTTEPGAATTEATASTKASISQLRHSDKEISKLHSLCKEQRIKDKKKEKQRAQAMFSSSSTSSSKGTGEDTTKDTVGASPSMSLSSTMSDDDDEEYEDALEEEELDELIDDEDEEYFSTPNSSVHSSSSPSPKQQEATKSRGLENVKKRVSFSDHVEETVYERDEDDEIIQQEDDASGGAQQRPQIVFTDDDFWWIGVGLTVVGIATMVAGYKMGGGGTASRR